VEVGGDGVLHNVLWITPPPAEKVAVDAIGEISHASVDREAPFLVVEVENRVGGTVMLHDGSMFENPAENVEGVFASKTDAAHLERCHAGYAGRLIALAKKHVWGTAPDMEPLAVSPLAGRRTLKDKPRQLAAKGNEDAAWFGRHSSDAQTASLLWSGDDTSYAQQAVSSNGRAKSDILALGLPSRDSGRKVEPVLDSGQVSPQAQAIQMGPGPNQHDDVDTGL
jgi:hypothetical protein